MTCSVTPSASRTLLACIDTLAKRKGDPFDLSDWPGDLGERAVRRVRQIESRLAMIAALADLDKIDRPWPTSTRSTAASTGRTASDRP